MFGSVANFSRLPLQQVLWYLALMENQTITIEQLYPHLSDPELKVAEENLTAYLALVLRIHARLEQDRTLEVLTAGKTLPRFKAKVDS